MNRPNRIRRLAAVSLLGAMATFAPDRAGAQTILRSFVGDSVDFDGVYGRAISLGGDFDGDAVPDVIVGTPLRDEPVGTWAGRAYVYSGATGATIHVLDAENAFDNLGNGVAGVADLNGDSRADFVIGADGFDGPSGSSAGRVYVHSGADAGLLYAIDADQGGARFGGTIVGLPDVDGDAMGDFAAAAPRYDGAAGIETGKVYLYSGATGTEIFSWEGEDVNDELGDSLAAGDVDDDGVADVIAGAPGHGPGRAYAFSGATGATLLVMDGEGPSFGDRFGEAVASPGDVDGDGHDDVVVGAPGALTFENRGKIYVYSGDTGALLDEFEGERDGDQFGQSVAGGFDMDGDGVGDYVAGSQQYPAGLIGNVDRGRLYFYSGATGTLRGTVTGETRGDELAAGPDVDGDGRGDLLARAVESMSVDLFSTPACLDADLDGYGASASFECANPEADCDDADPGVNPAATESCDGVDEDCDGEVDEGFDEDSDGFTVCGGDCDDTDEDVNPAAAEICNGVDDDCDGTSDDGLGDGDGDGWGAACECDDTDPGINPDVVEIPGNGIDENCDGLDGPPVPLFAFDGEAAGDEVGAVSGVGDVNGDAVPDILVGAANHDGPAGVDSGKVYVYSGANGSLIDDIDGEAAGVLFGISVAGGGDVDGDAVADFLVGGPGGAGGNGRAYLYSGATRALLATADGPSFGFYGVAVAALGDVNADTIPDWAVGAPFEGTFSNGTVRVLSGPTLATLAVKNGPRENSSYGFALSGAPDANGDGRTDLVIGLPGYPHIFPGGEEPAGGAVDFVSGANLATIQFMTGENTGASLGMSVAGSADVNGDGRGDFLAGSPIFGPVPGVSGVAGRAYLRSGLFPTTIRLWNATESDERLGAAVASAGDVNGDGSADHLIGSPLWDGLLGTDGGKFLLASGANGAMLLEGGAEAPGDRFGAPLASAGDLTGDGRSEVIVAAPGHDGPGGVDAGKVYVFDLCTLDADADGFSICGGDCDDDDPDVNPGEAEIPNNGIDDDCNPATPGGCVPQTTVAVPDGSAGSLFPYVVAVAILIVGRRRRGI